MDFVFPRISRNFALTIFYDLTYDDDIFPRGISLFGFCR